MISAPIVMKCFQFSTVGCGSRGIFYRKASLEKFIGLQSGVFGLRERFIGLRERFIGLQAKWVETSKHLCKISPRLFGGCHYQSQGLGRLQPQGLWPQPQS